MRSLYKVGDIVRVRPTYHLGSTAKDYPHTFTSEMLELYGGKWAKITRVCLLSGGSNLFNMQRKHYVEPYRYHIEGDGAHVWSAAMFIDAKEELRATIF